ncbi:hypothetical protein CWB99_11935 [Pseudoalteromonas rubra]|uniref:Uncharacterized protein n=1 Tax=Pseudoalteromonas rubra TaxID=43658 RepID=A0A5S3WMJ4_9GAMM|nr:hypothetical protein [Pseudoalteromonas rubra]TMP28419.1 hypothetical protein CWB99_11935 [Pseudoalteromonas rubra]TMP37178.1 hypothetical protein CWC00_00060 [Pseudoalteromonas rubra]
MEINNSKFGDTAFGSFTGSLQVLFDESILNGAASHESWSHAWGRAVAYAWEKEENKAALLHDPALVLSMFNYKLPAGVNLKVVDANRHEDQSVVIEATSSNLQYQRDNLKPGYFKAYLIDPGTIVPSQEQGYVTFSLVSTDNASYFNVTKKWSDVPVNGWVDIPATGVIVKHPSGRLWYITTEEIPENSPQWSASQFSQMMDDFIHSNPSFLNLGSTVIMKLPPKPEEQQDVAMSLMDYDALGKIYPFTT